jgi:hypothetical protein
MEGLTCDSSSEDPVATTMYVENDYLSSMDSVGDLLLVAEETLEEESERFDCIPDEEVA